MKILEELCDKVLDLIVVGVERNENVVTSRRNLRLDASQSAHVLHFPLAIVKHVDPHHGEYQSFRAARKAAISREKFASHLDKWLLKLIVLLEEEGQIGGVKHKLRPRWLLSGRQFFLLQLKIPWHESVSWWVANRHAVGKFCIRKPLDVISGQLLHGEVPLEPFFLLESLRIGVLGVFMRHAVMDNIHVLRMQAVETSRDVFFVEEFVDERRPHNICNLLIIFDRPEPPRKADRGALGIAMRVITIINLALVLELLEDVVLYAFLFDSVDEHVNLLDEEHQVLFALLGWADVDC